MIQISPLLLLIFGELLLVTTAVALVLIFLSMSRKRRERVAIKQLIGRIKEDERRREEETGKILGNRYGIKTEGLEEAVKKIGRSEKLFYQILINLFIRRDPQGLQTLNLDFENAVEPYRTLEIPQGESASAAPAEGEGGADSQELERLHDENRRLSEELQVTMDTMGRMLNEYSSMFAGGDGQNLDKGKMIEMFQEEELEKEAEAETGPQPDEVSPEQPAEPEDDPEKSSRQVADELAFAVHSGKETAQAEQDTDDQPASAEAAAPQPADEETIEVSQEDLDDLDAVLADAATGDREDEAKPPADEELLDLDAALDPGQDGGQPEPETADETQSLADQALDQTAIDDEITADTGEPGSGPEQDSSDAGLAQTSVPDEQRTDSEGDDLLDLDAALSQGDGGQEVVAETAQESTADDQQTGPDDAEDPLAELASSMGDFTDLDGPLDDLDDPLVGFDLEQSDDSSASAPAAADGAEENPEDPDDPDAILRDIAAMDETVVLSPPKGGEDEEPKA